MKHTRNSCHAVAKNSNDMAASQRSVSQSQRTTSTSTQASSASSNETSTLSGTPPTSIETSPVLGSIMPTRLNRQPTHITSGPAQEPSNPTNSDTQPANATPDPAINRPGGKGTKARKARTAFTEQEKKDRHKRNEVIRRNRIASAKEKLKTWVPAEFKIQCNKTDNWTEYLTAAVDWLVELKAGNDELENTYNALLEAHNLISEGYLEAETQLQEQQQQQQHQQQLQLPTPPTNSPPHPQPALHADELFNSDGADWTDPTTQARFESLQQATPPPQLNQGYERVVVSVAEAYHLHQHWLNNLNHTA